jgi:hypothetical protein
MTACVRIRPGGPAVVVAATVVGVLALLVGLVLALLVAYLITTDPPGWPALIPLMPSLLVMALSLWLVRRAASGFVLEAAGIRQAARHRALLPWADVGGLRWCRTRWWGRHNHQLVADLRDGDGSRLGSPQPRPARSTRQWTHRRDREGSHPAQCRTGARSLSGVAGRGRRPGSPPGAGPELNTTPSYELPRPGAVRAHGCSCSSCPATASRVASLPGRPTSCTESGIPFGCIPQGTAMAGQPARFQGAANGA